LVFHVPRIASCSRERFEGVVEQTAVQYSAARMLAGVVQSFVLCGQRGSLRINAGQRTKSSTEQRREASQCCALPCI